MLFNLSIENVALIEKADISFGEGFHVLTGETGAGKSILIGSVNMLLGERVGRNMIRNGESYAYVEGLFYITKQTKDYLAQFDVFAEEDGSLIISRKLTADGKNLCKAGGKTVSVSTLREIGRCLINVHGQHDNQALLDRASHIHFLDALADAKAQESFAAYQTIYAELKDAKSMFDSLCIDEAEKNRKADLMLFEIDEIREAAIYPGEEEELKAQRNLAKNKESFIESCANALDLMYENGEGVCIYNFLSDVQRFVEHASQHDTTLEKAASQIAEIRYSIEDITAAIRERLGNVEEQTFPLDEIEARLDLIYRLKRKYGSSEEEIIAYCEHAEQELADIESLDTKRAELEQRLSVLHEKARTLAVKNHEIRVKMAKIIEEKINAELADLNMEGAIFSIQIEECQLNKNGADKIEFLLSANKGEPLKPLSEIVSGGELSRIMLALKRILSAGDIAGTLIFDEIDTGISGRAAGKVGVKLKKISKQKQVLCVTHLPQIASLSDHHFKISKQQNGDKTVTMIDALNYDEKKAEIALMIGGDVVSDTTLLQAEDMMKQNSLLS